MKTLSLLALAALALSLYGCSPDHSADTAAPIPQQAKPKTALDQNPNVPEDVKKQIGGSIPPAPTGPTPGN